MTNLIKPRARFWQVLNITLDIKRDILTKYKQSVVSCLKKKLAKENEN